jgi:tetratricopeptide (TPR) repeat protein
MLRMNKHNQNKKSDERLWQKATNLVKQNKWYLACDLYDQLLTRNPENISILFQAALCNSQNGNYNKAYLLMGKAYNHNENDPSIISNYAVICSRLSQLEKAEILLEKATLISPNNVEYLTNLAVIYSQREKLNLALEKTKLAITLDKLNPKLYSILGSILVKLGLNEQAKTAYNFAIKIDPLFSEAKLNLATLESKEGNTEIAIKIYEELIQNFTNSLNSLPIEIIKFSLSFEYLKKGILNKGWDYYEFGFHPNIPTEYKRTPARTFNVPTWKGEQLSENDTLLVWCEQGIGDELIFMSCLPDLESLSCKVIIECEPRLIPLIMRSFPKFLVRRSSYLINDNFKSLYQDYDFHIPVGSLMKYYRNNINDFNGKNSYLKVNESKATEFESRISEKSASSLRIGICWRSGKLNPERNIFYSALSDWGEIFSVKNLFFVNLQYGDCENEIVSAEASFNVEIHRWNDLDLKNDFDSTMALISRLDLVISVGTAVFPMAASIGVPVLLMAPKDWTNFGTNHFPFFENITCLFPPKDETVSACIKDISKILLLLKNN